MKLKLLGAFFPALFLTACSSTLSVDNEAERMLDEKIETSINKSVQDIAKALQEIQNISMGKTVKATVDPNKTMPIDNTVASRKSTLPPTIKVNEKRIDAQSSEGKQLVLSKLDQKTNLKWSGDANDLLRNLSQKIGFAYSTEGAKTKLPVNINAKNKSVKEVLGLIDQQTSSKADIRISSIDRTIKFIYK